MGPAVSKIGRAALVVAAVAPSLMINVGPKLPFAWQGAAFNWGALGAAVFWGMSVAAMAACPFAIRKAPDLPSKLGALVLASILFILNVGNAIEVATETRDSKVGTARGTISDSAALKSRLETATAAMAQLPQVPLTTAAMAAAADDAVKLAQQDRDGECSKVAGGRGGECKRLVAVLESKTAAREAVLANRAVSEQRAAYQTEIDTVRKAQHDMGGVPSSADPLAARMAQFLTLLHVNLGPKPEEFVSEWWPTWIGIGIEFLALLGGNTLATAFMRPGEAPAARAPRQWLRRRRSLEARPAMPVTASETPSVAAPMIAAPVKTAATAARSKKVNKSKPAAVGDATTVREWKEARTVARAGSEIKPKETYDGAYVPWCREAGYEPVSFTKFGMVMKGELGVEYVERNKRGFYVGVALLGASPRVAVDNTGRRVLGRMAAGRDAP